ncbi:FtsX-like permease family protein [Sorangium sp. So ce341]|uniref:FtsX-like permease family protein n=1 Tax=Sorangium sp. So ce341 TaxID=3133302 RepID=UPI003F5D69FB
MIGPLVRALARRKTPALLTVLETAFGFAVAVHASGLALHYARAASVPRGIETRSLLLAVTHRDGPSLASRAEHAAAVRRDVEALARVAGVRGAAEATYAPFNRTHRESVEALAPGGPRALAWMLDDRGGVAEVLGLAPLEGRLLAPEDAAPAATGDAAPAATGDAAPAATGEPAPAATGDAAPAAATPAVVTRALAARLFPDGRALGQVVRRSARQRPLVIVGVVPSFRAALGPDPDAESALFAADGPWLGGTLTYLVRLAPGPDDGAAARVREALERADPRRVALVRRLDEGVDLDTGTNRGAGGLALTLIGLMLAVVFLGRVGMASLLVAERRQAIGIRRALGATRGDVARLVLAENALLTTAGLAAGAVALAALRAAARAAAPGLEVPLDPLAVGLVAAAIWLAGMAAALLPARRASAVPPAEASRS